MAASGSLDVFRLFPRLPQELRLQIWKLTIQPRVLIVRSVPPNSVIHPTYLEYFYSSNPVPSIFFACKESRLEALSLYTKAFSAGSTPRYIWANFTFDTIQIDDHSLPKLKIGDRQLIRWLVVDSAYADLFNHYIFCGGFRGLRSLEELDILASQDIWRWEKATTDLRFDLTRQFSGLEAWECPNVRIFAVETDLNSLLGHIDRE